MKRFLAKKWTIMLKYGFIKFTKWYSLEFAIKEWYLLKDYLMKGKITAEILSKTRNVNTINEGMVFYFLA